MEVFETGKKETLPNRSTSTSTSGSFWPCYITTIICDILEFSDDCGELNALRGLGDKVLQKDEKYATILYEYDVVGSQIAKKLEEDYQKTKEKEFATLLFNFYIQPSARLYHEGKVEENYDYEKGGYGQVKIKKLGSYFDVLREGNHSKTENTI